MDDPVFKQKYQKYKLRVKLWEKDFKKKYNRIPSKYDIRDASKDIRDSYKMYYKLKTSFLEDTLNDVLFEDGFDILETSQGDNDESMQDSLSGPQLPLDISNISNMDSSINFSNLNELTSSTQITNTVNLNEDHVIKEFEPVENNEHNTNAWGKAVSKKPAPQKSTSPIRQVFKSNLTAKLFKSSSFSKRNPRKSLAKPNKELSQSSVTSSQSETQDPMELLPDLETILTQRAKELANKEPNYDFMSAVGLKKPKNSSLQLDMGWLSRNVTDDENSFMPGNQKREPIAMGLSNLNNISHLIANEDKQESTIVDSPMAIPEPTEVNPKPDNSPLPITEPVEVPTKPVEDKNDSDSIVSNSEDEKESQEVRRIVKRRRVLTTIDKNQQTTPIAVEKEPIKLPPIRIMPEDTSKLPSDETSQATEVSPVVAKKRKRKVIDTSEDDEEDKKPKRTRKKAPATKKKLPKKEKEATIKTKAKKGVPKPTGSRKPTRVTKKQQEQEALQEEEDEGKAPDPEDIKYTLALETKNLRCLPRANVEDLKMANSMADDYINNITDKIGAVTNKPEAAKRGPVNTKREADREKLAQKVASGKLNENFVRINIQKKVFVRGKKTVNFSKYKKAQWKQKKAAALIGPEMNMGGCDGGILTCFQCGQPGHFAQQCKVKGDTLLPASVDIDEDSPYLTLEEAEKMASQSAVVVHSRNLDKLPQATNTLLYRQGDDEEEEEEENEDDNENEKEEDIVSEICKEIEAESETQKPSEISSPTKKYIGHSIPQDFLEKAGLLNAPNVVSKSGAIYELNPDGSVPAATEEVYEALRMFGHTDFRKGQDRAIMRILSGQSTLVTLSTGSGKSLCYQLPAYLYSKKMNSITLVISPLVSLMEDQVHGVPHFLRAHCLHTNQTPQQRIKILDMINNGEIDILLVSPEAVVAGERSTGFGSILRKLPPIAFACIDEAHCVSQWSHNFRPSYLMICKVLQKNLGVKTVLGLTATATLPTRTSIIRHLGIPDGEKGIISDVPLPDNLILSVSKDANRDTALIGLLLSKRFDSCQSIIIYCTRRDECERIAGQIRTYMQDRKAEPTNAKKRKRVTVNWQAEPYHAGLPASRRRTIQNAFMRNELRIVVATIAFGMGINKPDIRSVIHYNMPRNFESYVQEIGRAGRDGKISHCHLFLDSKGGDQNELRRHIFANSIDRHVIRKLLQKLFIPCSCDKNLKKNDFVNEHRDEIMATQDIDWDEEMFDTDDNPIKESHSKLNSKQSRKRICPGHEIGISIEKTVQALDIPEENISTLLCYLELDHRWGINVLSSAYIMCKVVSYGGAKYLKHAAKDCPPLAMAIALQLKNKTFKEDSNTLEFSVIDIAAAIGWNSGVVKYQLKNLEWITQNGYPKRSPLTVTYFDLGFRVQSPGDFTLDEIDEALDCLYERSVKQEHTQLIQLQYVFQGLSSVSYKSYIPCTTEDFPQANSDKLKLIVREYFQNDYPKDLVLDIEESNVTDDEITGDIYSIINMYPDNTFSGRNIARIFHGIQSPNFPAVIWGRCRYWRAHSKTDFNRIVKLANSIIVKMRT
ncbi:ATP-dependent DNA helicase Q4 [Episyrphus balteatus]|uniref:ATP-dependent DNA helicase Q4 n=1 Tax=Episyrphus balteatus TaxID=286459 RepID=UPI002486B2B8|nr:ATP-dependent DNA helicase Q4 [Episyrphus balteatus]